MLDEVTVSNLGLIDAESLTIGDGLTVVSGETGTGKTLMLGALRLLRGDTAPKDVIGPHGDATDVSALVTLDGHDVVIRRTVGSSRSKAYFDGQISPARELAERIGPHITIVGQHDQHLITSSSGVRRLVDLNLNPAGTKAKNDYAEKWAEYTDLIAAVEELGGDARTLARELETLRFQIAEIDDAGFVVGDEEDLRSVAARLRSAVELEEDVSAALSALGSDELEESFASAIHALERASRVDQELAERLEQANDVASLASDLTAELSRYATDLAAEDQDLGDVERRLADLAQLKRKYGDTIGDIDTFRKDAATRATQLSNVLEQSTSLDQAIRDALDAVESAGDALRNARQVSANALTKQATAHLRDLGFSDPKVTIEVSEREPATTGCDHLAILFASDAALTPAPIAAIASGGELSRLVLALTVAAGGADAAVVAFDEIDAGVGGTTALAMGEKLAALAEGRQVICVTHLPQVAAFGRHHLVVSRDGTSTTVAPVTGPRRLRQSNRSSHRYVARPGGQVIERRILTPTPADCN